MIQRRIHTRQDDIKQWSIYLSQYFNVALTVAEVKSLLGFRLPVLESKSLEAIQHDRKPSVLRMPNSKSKLSTPQTLCAYGCVCLCGCTTTKSPAYYPKYMHFLGGPFCCFTIFPKHIGLRWKSTQWKCRCSSSNFSTDFAGICTVVSGDELSIVTDETQ